MENTQATTEETEDTPSQPQQRIKTVDDGIKLDMPGRDSRLGDVYRLESHLLVSELEQPEVIQDILVILIETSKDTVEERWKWEQDQGIPLGSKERLESLGASILFFHLFCY